MSGDLELGSVSCVTQTSCAASGTVQAKPGSGATYWLIDPVRS